MARGPTTPERDHSGSSPTKAENTSLDGYVDRLETPTLFGDWGAAMGSVEEVQAAKQLRRN
jgi:hypothetical protein